MKHILITGSTDGIGKLTALKLAKEGNTVYLNGRSEAKVNKVVAEIKEASNNPNIKGFISDFSDLNAVKQLAIQIKNEVPSLDILINNAGIFKTAAVKTKDGLDIRMAVNYLAPYILTENIVPVLEKGTATRIVNLSSAAQSSVKKGILTGDVAINASDAYAQSKLALTMWSFHFAKQHPNITTIAVNPGSLLNTKMAKEAYGQHWSPAEKGVNILYDLATSDVYKDATGKYFDNDKGETIGRFSPAHPDAYDETKIDTLLEITSEIVNK
ncbi:short-chain dehydrogenase [Polaribacter reichenbachii]|uniref:Short-chain dehydrogenase n=1 Tax=Polaribacter reichenbachii TaxID=996801 RepID=A0A1B8U4F0_9FLAO|nr:SDR family NAD(P)-dependent oxidoreductase [Polaribacter reichenbachii]APZ47472.1 short-chain dehydrogenase [Polaribacter reichenbachii]AUC18111.1 short-chain dehydrogenase [Polaribacter reichenbachii]OBY66722.1 short-chain dehydrogenase [Polaribacter reichenbachii]